MKLHTASESQNEIALHILLEQQPNTQFRASIPALPNCTLERATREEALEAIQHLLSERLATLEVLPVQIPVTADASSTQAHSWKPFLGMFKDDPYFTAIADELWAKRQLEDDEEIAVDLSESNP
jgi:predicted RNase H-like HicB family nuclease